MSTSTVEAEVRAYVEMVASHLHDLPEDERRDLKEDLFQHLLEVAAEGDGSLEDRLGPPEEYARDLRASVDLPDDLHAGGAIRRLAARIERSRFTRAIAALRRTNAVRSFATVAPQFQPAWWALRGYVAVSMAAVSANHGYAPSFAERATVVDAFVPFVFGSRLAGVLAGGAAAWFSYAIGRRASADPRASALSIGISILTIVLVYSGLTSLGNVAIPDRSVDTASYLQHGDGTPIHNICPYASDGTPLSGVLLFDENGRAIRDVAGSSESYEYDRSQKPVAIENAYPQPIKIVDPETGFVRDAACPPLKIASTSPSRKTTVEPSKKAAD